MGFKVDQDLDDMKVEFENAWRSWRSMLDITEGLAWTTSVPFVSREVGGKVRGKPRLGSLLYSPIG